jgi:hypothetical protein
MPKLHQKDFFIDMGITHQSSYVVQKYIFSYLQIQIV